MEILERKLDPAKTLKSFREVVWIYDFWGRITERKAARKVIELADIRDGKSLLEVACGTGVVFEQLVRKNPNGQNTGIDLSPDMLDKARKRLRSNPCHYELKEADALNLDFADNAFDVVVNNFMVDLLPQEYFDRLAREFYRVLKPQGVFVISTFSFGNKKIHKFWLWVARHFPDLLTGCRPVSFREYLIRAGFTIEKQLEVSQNTFPSEIIKARKNG